MLITATIFAMATGIVGASVAVLGIMAGPIILKAGYDDRLSAGAIAAGGTLGILIPPSVMLVVMGPVMGVPVNALYAACMGPGFVLAGSLHLYCLVRSFINPKLGPPLPREERITDLGLLAREFLIGVVPLAALITVTLGTILGGLATATEAASCGALGATLLALAYGKLTPAGAEEGGDRDGGHGQHGADPRRGLQRVRRDLHPARRGDRDHGCGQPDSAAGHGQADRHHGGHLPARLAVRVAGDHPGVRADLPAGGRDAPARPLARASCCCGSAPCWR